MTLEEYTTLIQKKFAYLFKDYGFQIVHKEKYRPGYDWFRVGLESKSIRVLFEREQGGGTVFLGSTTSSFSHESNLQWVNLSSILIYLLKEKWDWSFSEEIPYKERPSAILSFYAEKLQPMCEQVLKMFKSQEAIEKWKPDYEKYLNDRFQLLYGSKKHHKN